MTWFAPAALSNGSFALFSAASINNIIRPCHLLPRYSLLQFYLLYLLYLLYSPLNSFLIFQEYSSFLTHSLHYSSYICWWFQYLQRWSFQYLGLPLHWLNLKGSPVIFPFSSASATNLVITLSLSLPITQTLLWPQTPLSPTTNPSLQLTSPYFLYLQW